MSTTYTDFLHLGLQENKNDKLDWDLVVGNWKTLDSAVQNRQTYDITTTLDASSGNEIDADHLIGVGSYQFSYTAAAYISHLPTGLSTDSRLDVIKLPSDRRQQIIRPIGSAPVIYVRNSTSATTPYEGSLIPAMTSATTPSGEVIESGHYDDRYGYQAFDGVDSQTWQSHAWTDGTNVLDGTADKCYVGYIWNTAQVVSSVKISFSSDTAYTGCIQCKVNGAWQTVIESISIARSGYTAVEQSLTTPVECTAIRFCVLSGDHERFCGGNYGGNVCEMIVYGTGGLTATWGDWYSIGMTVVQ